MHLVVPLLIFVLALWMLLGGVKIIRSGEALACDPFVIGPLTGGIGYFVLRWLIGDRRVGGWTAKLMGGWRICFGSLLLLGVLAAATFAGIDRFRDGDRAGEVMAGAENARFNALSPASSALASGEGTSSNGEEESPKAKNEPAIRPMPKDWMPEGLHRR